MLNLKVRFLILKEKLNIKIIELSEKNNIITAKENEVSLLRESTILKIIILIFKKNYLF